MTDDRDALTGSGGAVGGCLVRSSASGVPESGALGQRLEKALPPGGRL